MNWNFKELLPEDFAPDSRVWVYQSSRLFTMGEALQLEDLLNHFAANWKSHGTPVKGFGTLFFGQFIILMADESATGVSGCSTDSSVRLIKDIEGIFKVHMFDRLNLAFVIKDKVQLLPQSQVKYALENKFIDENTIFFNNVVQTKEELENNWMLPLKESWLGKRVLPAKTEG
ncbi:hypothetical protein [Pseudobacter ginsenosidimutans]|uniref:ABC transporter ATPase n=1 Tax=Pseudobacter ginsenosidimutans TaxID=661488 RepID=A0A4Q7N5Y1_9BACT|nr:hypothetical protein [Pseudobacter ginsenosidimutans]QEC44978.1 hypothetical protein FSB84_26065 [Pseudobacter ginsenosidimutans]RZS76472.1 hypothetical protein EV199_2357 [Pseudobacter ginsenosidimutans]